MASVLSNSSTHLPGFFAPNSSSKSTHWNTYNLLEVVVYAGLGTVEWLVGMTTNVINTLVFWRQGLRDRMNLCLFFISLFDFCFFTVMFAISSLPIFISFHDKGFYEEYYSKAALALMSVNRGLALTSGCITMAVSVDTCVCVVLPHRAASLMRTKTMCSLIIMCFLFLQCCYLISPFSFNFSKIIKEDSMKFVLVSTNFFKENKLLLSLFINIILETVVPCVIVTVILVTTTVTVKSLRSGIRFRENVSNASSNARVRQVALIKMLTIVACVYTAVLLPRTVFQLYIGISLPLLDDKSDFEQFTTISVILFVFSQIKGCFNFFIYYYRSSRFKRELCSMFRCKQS